MRIFVSFENVVYTIDANVGKTVGEIKNCLQEKFGLNLKNSQNENDSVLALVHQGSSLQDKWVYSDLGIPAGTTLVCRIEKRVEPALTVFCPCYEETIRYKESFRVWQTLVATLRVMIQDSTGIHVSAFRLYSAAGVELFDCHPLKVYGVNVGDTVTMEIWHDVEDLVKAARENDITDTLQALASFHEAPHLMRYQLQLGLFTAAHFGYHQLATQLIKCGARPNEPVGQHPSRDWCRAAAHTDHMKTPAHEAAQHGRVTCLQHFLMFNYSVLICKDAQGLTPCNVARKYKQTECFKLLVAEQFRIPTVSDLSIHVYSRVRKWCDRAKSRARLHKDKTVLLLLSNAEVACKAASVGQRVEVDGYKSNVHEQGDTIRQLKSTASTTRSGSPKSHVSQCTRYTHQAENCRGNALQKQQGFSSAPPSRAAELNRDVTFPRSHSTRSTRVMYQTTKLSTKQSGRSANLSRRTTTAYGRKATMAEKQREDSKGRYVWRYSADDEKNENHRTCRDNEGQFGNVNHRICRDNEGQSGNMNHRICTDNKGQSGNVNHRINRDNVGQSGNVNHRINRDNEGQSRNMNHRICRDNKGQSGNVNHRINRDVGQSGNVNHRVCRDEGQSGNANHRICRDNEGQSGNVNHRINRDSEGQSGRSHTRKTYDDNQGIDVMRSEASNVQVLETGRSWEQGDRKEFGSANTERRMRGRSISSGKPSTDLSLKGHRISPSNSLVYQRSVDSADKCLRVASETFRRKSWLGQLQMALVVNTNMCKRRQNEFKQQDVLEPRLEPPVL